LNEKSGYFVAKRNVFDNKIFRDCKTYLVYSEILRLISHKRFTIESDGYNGITLQAGQTILKYSHLERWNIKNYEVSRIILKLKDNNLLNYETKYMKSNITPQYTLVTVSKDIFTISREKPLQQPMQHQTQQPTINNYNDLQDDLQQPMQQPMQQPNELQHIYNNKKNLNKKNSNKNKDKEKINKKESFENSNLEQEMKQFDLSFVDSNFIDIFNEFIQFRKDLKKPFKTMQGIRGCYNNLIELSNNNPDTAKLIVKQSIANEWQGLFPIKNNQSGYNQKPRSNYMPLPDSYDEPEKPINNIYKMQKATNF